MPDAVIENPILNSPFREPTRHFRFDDEGITNEIVEARRLSSYFIPIPAAKKKAQLEFETEWTKDRIEENKVINRIRERVGQWRNGGCVGVTPTTRLLLEYWTEPDREKPLFFCQIEALETAIYITEVAGRYGDAWIENLLAEYAHTHNPGLYRIAFKMATGIGKTVVMAMLIAWQALNKLANPQDARFSRHVPHRHPGITIRDRLRVLLPNDPSNYYRQRDIVPAERCRATGPGARSLITNFHAFLLRETRRRRRKTHEGDRSPAGRSGVRSPRRPTRWCAGSAASWAHKKNIVVLNDEAHHCYRRKLDDEDAEKLDRRRARRGRSSATKEARVWIIGLEAVAAQDRRPSRLRPVGHAVLPAGSGLPGRARSSPGWSPTSR